MLNLRSLVTTGPGRLFLVAWLGWALFRYVGLVIFEDSWLIHREDHGAEWLLTGLAPPPVVAAALLWVAAGFRRNSAAPATTPPR